MVRNKHLVAVELDIVLLYGHAVLYLREVEDARKSERIVDIKMNIEKRILLRRI